MGIVQTAIQRLIGPTVEQTVSSMIQSAPGLSAADRVTLDKAAAMVAEFEALADGQFEPPPDGEGGITLPGIDQ